jgi:hypothetical protein
MRHEESTTAPVWIRWGLILAIGLILLGVVLVTALDQLTLTGDIVYYISMGVTLALLAVLLRNFTRLRITVSDSEVTFTSGGRTRTIPLTAVTDCTVSTPGAPEGFAGVARFLSVQPRVRDLPGIGAGVLLEVEENGERRHYFLSSSDPDLLATRIRERISNR